MSLKFLTVSMWAASAGQDSRTLASLSDASVMRQVREMRKAAIDSHQLNWWMHFDWWSWTRGQVGLLQDSISRLDKLLQERPSASSSSTDDGSPLDATSVLMKECRLFMLVLLGYDEVAPILNTAEAAALELIEDHRCTSTVVMMAALICLRERVERGEAAAARLLYERASPHVSTVTDGCLPGMLRVDPTVVRMAWARVVGVMSLRAGEMPTDLIRALLPEQVRHFCVLSEPRMRESAEAEGQEREKSMRVGAQGSSTYAEQLQRLTGLLQSLQDSTADTIPRPSRVLHQLAETISGCPQLESFRLLITALASHQAHQPVHQVKGSLLEALKLLNGTTQNVFLKTLVLLLVGRLYLETDWEMAVKMNAAAHVFAAGAGWEHLGLIASLHLALAHGRLGQQEEMAECHRRAEAHRRALRDTDANLLSLIEGGHCT